VDGGAGAPEEVVESALALTKRQTWSGKSLAIVMRTMRMKGLKVRVGVRARWLGRFFLRSIS